MFFCAVNIRIIVVVVVECAELLTVMVGQSIGGSAVIAVRNKCESFLNILNKILVWK